MNGINGDLFFQSETGNLNVEQIELILNILPLDITLVDENDKVVYFSNPKDRFFPRSPAIIGRDVKNCHPPESVHIVEEIVKAMADPRLNNVELIILNGASYFKKEGRISHNIIAHKKYPADQLAQWYRSADAMVHIAWIDNCPNTVVESLSCGIPVLSTHNGGTHELVKNNGKIISEKPI